MSSLAFCTAAAAAAAAALVLAGADATRGPWPPSPPSPPPPSGPPPPFTPRWSATVPDQTKNATFGYPLLAPDAVVHTYVYKVGQ